MRSLQSVDLSAILNHDWKIKKEIQNYKQSQSPI